MTDENRESEVMLTGLTGGNLLAFLAALGTFRVLSLALPTERIRMSWRLSGGAWRPLLHLPPSRRDTFGDILVAELGKSGRCSALAFADNPSVEPHTFLKTERSSVDTATISDRTSGDFMAAFGSAAWRNDNGNVQDTAFRTMQGAGHQHFIKTIRDLVAQTTNTQIRYALFESWVPIDERLGMRWDACEDRPYALRWRNPSAETVLTVRGANRLAIEALPLFPTAGLGSELETTGFTFPRRGNPRFSFPIWDSPITVDTVRSLLATPLFQEKDISSSRRHLADLGVRAVYRCERVTTGKFRNFTPTFPL